MYIFGHAASDRTISIYLQRKNIAAFVYTCVTQRRYFVRVFVLKFMGVVWIVYSIEISIKDILSTATIYTASFDTLDFKNRVDQYSLSQPEEVILILNQLLFSSFAGMRRYSDSLHWVCQHQQSKYSVSGRRSFLALCQCCLLSWTSIQVRHSPQ